MKQYSPNTGHILCIGEELRAGVNQTIESALLATTTSANHAARIASVQQRLANLKARIEKAKEWGRQLPVAVKLNGTQKLRRNYTRSENLFEVSNYVKPIFQTVSKRKVPSFLIHPIYITAWFLLWPGACPFHRQTSAIGIHLNLEALNIWQQCGSRTPDKTWLPVIC